MERLIIEKFEDFLEFQKLNEDKGQPSAIVMMRASTSTSDVQTGLAKTLGIENDKSYTFTVNLFDLFYSTGNKKKFDPKMIGEGTKIKPGADVLTIGDKTITEKGEIVLSKKDTSTKDIKITASGNGLLCLYRMSLAISELLGKYMISMDGRAGEASAKDWIMKFTLGGSKEELESREYSFYYAYPGSLQSTANTMVRVLEMAMLENTKQGNLISRNNPDHKNFDSVVDSWYNGYIKGTKSIGEALQKYLEYTSKDLAKRFILVNPSPKLNMTNVDALIKNANKYYAPGQKSDLYGSSGVSTIQLNGEGINAFKKVISDMSESLVPTVFTGWGKEADPLIEQYKSAIKLGLSSSGNINSGMSDVQRVSQYSKSEVIPGSSGSGGKKFREGGV